MNLAEARIVVGINLDIYKGLVQYLYEKGKIPKKFEISINGLEELIEVSIDQPRIELRTSDGPARLGLAIDGSVPLVPENPTQFSVWIKLRPFVRNIDGEAPVAAFEAEKIEEVTPEGLGDSLNEGTLQEVSEVLKTADVPIFDGLLNLLEVPVYGDNDPPSRSAWSADYYLGQPAEIRRVEVGFQDGNTTPEVLASAIWPTEYAMVASLALPGDSAEIPGAPSILPAHAGIQIVVGRSTMDVILADAAKSKVGEKVSDVTIDSLQMKMHDLGIETTGKASNNLVEINWGGVLVLRFGKYYINNDAIRWQDGYTNVLTQNITVDVDYTIAGQFLRSFLFGSIGPFFFVASEQYFNDKIDAAPDRIKNTFRNEVVMALNTAVQSAGDLSEGDEIPLQQFALDSWVDEGDYYYSVTALVGRNSDEIVSVEQDQFRKAGAAGSSVGLYRMASGKTLHPEELGRLLKSGVLKVSGVQGVHAPYGYYVRTIPNDTTDDNFVDPDDIKTF